MLVAVLSAPVPSSAHLWQSMILRCDWIIGADSGASALDQGLRKLDVAIGDFDSWTSLEGTSEPGATTIIRLSPQKDDSDTEAAVGYALEQGATEIWLFGGAGGRTDHWFSNWRLVERVPAIRRWYTAEEVLFRMNAPELMTYSAGRLSVLPLGVGPWKVTSEGLTWELGGVNFGERLSLSNHVAERASIQLVQGQILVARELSGQETSA